MALGECRAHRRSFIDITDIKHAEDLLLEREAERREAQRLAEVDSWSRDIRTGIVRSSEELDRFIRHDPPSPVPPYGDQELFHPGQSDAAR